MKAYVETPSGRKVEFDHDEKVHFLCEESGTHWLGASSDDGRWMYRELYNIQPGMIIQAAPVAEWKLEISPA